MISSPALFAADDNQLLLEKATNQLLTPEHILSEPEQEKLFTDINKALEKGAKFSEININFQENNLPVFKLPTFDVCQKILNRFEKSLDPNLYLSWILSYRITDSDFAIKREPLIALAVEKGANLGRIHQANPQVEYALHHNLPFIGSGQMLLTNHLALIGKKYPVINNSLTESFEKSYGHHCQGLTSLWLYSKWLQFTYPEKTYGYTNGWFKSMVQTISSWDGQRNMGDKEIANVQNFGSIIDLFQKPFSYKQGAAQEPEIPMALSKLDTNGKILKKRYSIVSVFNLEMLCKFLKETVYDDELIYINFAEVSHATGMFKHKGAYYYYDPNDNKGEYELDSIEKLAETILRINSEFGKNHMLAFEIYSFDEKSHTYPKQQDFLVTTYQLPISMNKDLLASNSVRHGALESLRFYLDKHEITEYDGFPLIIAAAIFNQPFVIKELLIRGHDPRQALEVEIPMDDALIFAKGDTALHIAARFNYIDMIRVILGNNRMKVDIEQKNSVGKTALDYAIENKNYQIVELLGRFNVKK